MIVGKGLIASLFTDVDQEDIVIFAFKCFNPSETNPAEFYHEEKVGKRNLPNIQRHYLYNFQYV